MELNFTNYLIMQIYKIYRFRQYLCPGLIFWSCTNNRSTIIMHHEMQKLHFLLKSKFLCYSSLYVTRSVKTRHNVALINCSTSQLKNALYFIIYLCVYKAVSQLNCLQIGKSWIPSCLASRENFKYVNCFSVYMYFRILL